ncbi:MAG: hypothetical protein J6C41_05695 [Oscillospiraceae bacterium]|nr:hypothetical protein [Oscillospiraceae bacterium]
MKKRIALLLMLAMVLSAMSMSVFAAEEETEEQMPVTKLYVGSVNALETPYGDGWSFDAENGVLTLNNCTLSESMVHEQDYVSGEHSIDDAMIYVEGDLTIELIGTNSVERVIEEEPTDYTQYFAIYAAVYATEVNGELWDYPSKLSFTGTGSLTAGIAITVDAWDGENWSLVGGWDEYLEFSAAIGCWANGSADLSGLHSGGWMDVYGGILGSGATPWNIKAFANSPTFGDNCIVTAYQDIEGNIENESGYNWNNNDAWRMKVVTADAHLNSKGLLTLLDSGAASGQGWTWENNVLTLSSDTEVKAVAFRAALGSAKLKLAGNVTLDCTDMGYDSNWNMIPCINANCDLEIDAGAYTLTFTGDTYTVRGNCADIMISGGTVEEDPEYSNGIYITGGGLTIQDATFRSSGGIDIAEGWDADWNSVPGGDILIQNAFVTLDRPINSYGNIVTVLNSDLTVNWGYSCIYAPNGIYLQDSNITLIASGIALDTNKTVSIDNCNLNIVSEQEVISCGYVSYNDSNTEADLSKLSLTNMNITEPAGYQILAVEENWGAKTVKLANSDGTLATSLIATAVNVSEECSHSYGDWVITTPATLQSTGEQQKTCTLCGNVISEEIPCLAGNVDSWNLTLDDNLSVNFKISIDEAIYDTAQVLITVCGNTTCYDVKELPLNTEDNSIIVSSVVAAAQMGETITVQIANGEDTSVTKTYSVLQYAQAVLADEALSSYHPLIKEMLNYGAMAQVYFDYDAENLVNDGITDAGKAAVPETAEDMAISGKISGLNLYGTSLVYRDRIAVRYYFIGDVTGLTFTANGNTYTPVAKNGMYYVEIADILPQDLEQQITLTAADINGNTLSVTYGPMNYIVRMTQKDNGNLRNLLKALYNYHLAAKACSLTA